MKNYQIFSVGDIVTIEFLKVPSHPDIIEAIKDLRQLDPRRLLWDFRRGLAFDPAQGGRVFAYILEYLGDHCPKMAFVARNGYRPGPERTLLSDSGTSPAANSFFESQTEARAWLNK